VHLFGGEPLLNADGCADLLSLAAGVGMVSAQMTTNGTLLTASQARRLADLGLGSVQITFDGNRTDHDTSRVRRSGGGGTFDDILANVAAAIDATDGIRWNFRVNVSRRNRAGLAEMVDQIAAAVDASRCAIGFALVHDAGIGFADTLDPAAGLVDDVVGWVVRAADLGFQISRPRPIQPCRTCTYRDGRLGLVANADGVLYSCWESAGKPGWEVGTVDTGYRPHDEVDRRWVACGYENRRADAAVAARFRDAVDARVLDYLHASGRLGLRTAPAAPVG
jgi:uncharacterized protein